MGIGGIGTTDITTDRIMAMGTVDTTIVGGNPASALAAPSGSKMMYSHHLRVSSQAYHPRNFRSPKLLRCGNRCAKEGAAHGYP